jgi:hypothetical protein
VIDQGTCWLRRIANGQVSSFADLGFGVCASRSTGLTGAEPAEVAVGPSGDVFVSDRRQHVIRRIDAAGAVTTFAGSSGVAGSADGQRSAALFRAPRGLAFDGGGNLYVADGGNQTVRRIAPDGTVTTLAGTAGVGGHVDGVGPAARFAGPRGVAVAAAQRLLVSDTTSHTVRQIDLGSGAVTTLAGMPFSAGLADGTGASARFDSLLGIAANASVAYVADTNNHLIRRIDGNGAVTRVAGQPSSTGSADGVGSAARFSWTNQIASDASGNIYMADIFNDAIRRISPSGSVTTLAGVAGQGGYADGTGAAARFLSPSHLATSGDGNLFVADNGNCVVRRISPLGAVLTIAGTAGMCGFDDGLPGQAKLGFFAGLAASANGTLVFSQTGYCVLRSISGVTVSIVAGNGTCDVVDGPQAMARVAAPAAMAFEANGDVVFVDRGPTVRRLRANGSVETIAGSVRGNADGGGTAARFENISALAVDASGRIYVADTGNQSLRLIDIDRSVRTLIPLAAGPRVVLGTPGSLNKPVGLALLPGNVVALTSEQSVLLD